MMMIIIIIIIIIQLYNYYYRMYVKRERAGRGLLEIQALYRAEQLGKNNPVCE